MRPYTYIRASLVAALAVAFTLAVALSLPGTARAGNGHGPKVDDRLAALADSKGPDATLDVVLMGRNFDKKNNGKHYGQLRRASLGLVGGEAETIKVSQLDSIASDPDVDFISLDAPMTPTGVVDYSKLATFYPLNDKANAAWDLNYNGAGVGIAVIDSGVAPVPDFGTRLVQVPRIGEPVASPDINGHGSLVAGIVGGKSLDGRFIGGAPGATIYSLNVDRVDGTHASDVIDALQWVFDNAHTYNIRVVNLSLSETVPGVYTQSTLDLAVERLWASGIVVVVSAGNLGSVAGATDYAPSNDPLAITVGAVDSLGTSSTSDDVMASFSSTGTTASGFAKPDVLAPGRLIASVLPAGTTLDLQAPAANRVAPGYATISGTSFAAPQVAAAAAIALQKNPGWSPDNVKSIFTRKGRYVNGTSVPALDLGFIGNSGTPGLANQGVPALVCAPSTTCLSGSTIASNWNSSSWNSSSWNSSSWNSSSWNSSSWNSSSWNSSSWNSSSWNSSSWNSSSWNSSSWNSSSWNSFSWD